MFKNKRVLMLISLLVSVGLWMYVMGSVDPVTSEKIVDIPVTMEGQDVLKSQQLTAELESPKFVSITIEGKRSQVNKAKSKGVNAVVDVSTCDYGKNEGKIRIDLADGVTGVTVESVSKSTAIFIVK